MEVEESEPATVTKTYETASDRAKLGTEVLTFLESGESVPQNLTISILKEALNRVPSSSGWIIENFPERLEFFEEFEREIVSVQAVLYVNCSDDEILALNSELESPNPDVVQKLSKFNDNWTEFKNAYSDRIHTFEWKKDNVVDEIEDSILEIVRLDNHQTPPPEKPKTPEPEPEPVQEPPEEPSDPSPPSRSKSRSSSAKKGKKRSDSAKSSKKGSKGSSRASSAKKKSDPEPPEEIIKPGDEKWEWVLVSQDESVPKDFYHRLHQSLLDSDSLIDRRLCKSLQNIRSEQYSVVEYLGDVLDSFKRFMKRPDPKFRFLKFKQHLHQ